MRRSTRKLAVLLLPLAAAFSGCARYVSAHRDRGDELFKQQKYREALAEYTKAVRFDSDNPYVIKQIGLAHYALREMREAFPYLSKAEELIPKDIDVRLASGNIYLVDRRPDEALKEAKAVLAVDPNNVNGLVLLGSALSKTGEPDKAADAYRRVAELSPESPAGPFLAAQSLLAAGKQVEAARQFDIALQRNPDHLGALTGRVQIDIAEQHPDDGLRRVESRLVASNSTPRANLSPPQRAFLARLTDLLGMVREARKELPAAEAAFLDAIALDSTFGGARIHLGEHYARAGKIKEAVALLEQAAKSDSTAPAAFMMLGLVYQQANDAPRAIVSYERVLELAPRSAAAANNLAWLLSEFRGDHRRALEVASVARNILPQDPHVADTYGWISLKAGNVRIATAALQQAAAKLPDDARVQYHLGVALQKSGDVDGARRALAKAVGSPMDFAGKDIARKALAELK